MITELRTLLAAAALAFAAALPAMASEPCHGRAMAPAATSHGSLHTLSQSIAHEKAQPIPQKTAQQKPHHLTQANGYATDGWPAHPAVLQAIPQGLALAHAEPGNTDHHKCCDNESCGAACCIVVSAAVDSAAPAAVTLAVAVPTGHRSSDPQSAPGSLFKPPIFS